MELLGGASVTLLSLVIVGIFFGSGLQQFALRSSGIAAVVSAILVDLANGDRNANGLATLRMNPALVAVAQAKANDMAAKGYFAHVSPEGIDPWHWFHEVGYEYSFAGENLAIDFSDSGDVERAWMNSPTHRQNILNSQFTEIGIATAQGIYEGRSTTFVVQVFGLPAQSGLPAGNSLSAPPLANLEEIPDEPTELAVTTAPTIQDEIQVLGSSAEEAAALETPPTMTEPVVAAALAEEVSNDIPLWGYLVGFPRDTLRYAYYFVGLLILLAFAIETGLELRAHHRRKAMHAGMLLAGMAILFVVADYAFFAEPVLAFISS